MLSIKQNAAEMIRLVVKRVATCGMYML